MKPTNTISIDIQRTEQSRIDQVDFDNLVFGREPSDHMFVVDYNGTDWVNTSVVPYGPFEFSPSMVSLHYGQTIFEGLKAFKNNEGDVFVFRPDMHAKRLNGSAHRLCMPQVPEEIFLQGLYNFLEQEKPWIPIGNGRSFYLRPLLFAMDETLGVTPSEKYKFIIFGCPVAGYYAGSVKVMVETEYVRAAEGGTGFIKAGGNYAASLLPAKEALAKGYQQLLWTDAKEHKYVEEAGTMNVMFQIDGKIVTPALSTSILGGITRTSILDLAKKWGLEVEERKVSVDELVEAHKNGLLENAFGTGTAATITQISHIGAYGSDMELPAINDDTFSVKAQDYLNKLKVGEAEDYMNWMVKL